MHSKRRNRLNPSRADSLVYVFCLNMKLIHSPTDISKRTAEYHVTPFQQTHDALVEERFSDDEMEWEITSECSDVEEIDDMVPFFDDVTQMTIPN